MSERVCRLAVIGGSWGGASALRVLLSELPDDFSLPLVAALHRSPSSSEEYLNTSLTRYSKLDVIEANDKMDITPGCLFVAPADYHLYVEGDHLALSIDEPVRFSRPSIDVLFESAADSCGENLVAVLLSGANDDGARGMVAVKRRGGRTFVQEPSTTERSEMPNAAIATGAVDRVLPVPAIAAALAALDPKR